MRKLVFFCSGFIAAMFISLYMDSVGNRFLLAALFAAAALVALLLTAKKRTRFQLIFFGAAFGVLWSGLYAALVTEPAWQLDGQETKIIGTVCDFPEEKEYGWVIDLYADTGSVIPVKTRLYLYDTGAEARMAELCPGDKLSFTATFSRSTVLRDKTVSAFSSKGILLIARQSTAQTLTSTRGFRWLWGHKYLARSLKTAVLNLMPTDVRPLALSVLFGDRSLLEQDYALDYNMQLAGVTHITAVSGMHVAFLLELLMLLFGRGRRTKLWLIPAVVLFMFLTGLSPSVSRAGIMALFMLAAPTAKRQTDSLTSLFAAVTLIVLINPYAAAGPSLQLSFAANLGILLFTDRCSSAMTRRLSSKKLYQTRWGKRLITSVISGLSASVGAVSLTLPISAAYFGMVSITSPLANLVLLGLVSIFFSIGLPSALLGACIPFLGRIGFWLAAWPGRAFIWLTKLLGMVPHAALYTDNAYAVIFLIIAYCMVITWFTLKGNGKQLLFIGGAIAVLFAGTLTFSYFSTQTDAYTVTVLDVGQGACIGIQSGGELAVVDCGSSSGVDAAESLRAWLSHSSEKDVDLLVLTHFHSDHVNGVKALLETVTVEKLAVPMPQSDETEAANEILTLARNKNIDIMTITEDVSVPLGSSFLNLYAPLGIEGENELGLIVLGTCGDRDVLITGDAGGRVEQMLIESKRLPDIELLVVGHHGSKNSCTEDFLNVLRPETAAISVGYNSYGHPSAETLERLDSKGITVFRTDEAGTVTFRMEDENGKK